MGTEVAWEIILVDSGLFLQLFLCSRWQHIKDVLSVCVCTWGWVRVGQGFSGLCCLTFTWRLGIS